MNQRERVLNHLQIYHSINNLEALNQLGVYRLSAVILDLRKAGHSIMTEQIEVINKYGESVRVAKYVLEV